MQRASIRPYLSVCQPEHDTWWPPINRAQMVSRLAAALETAPARHAGLRQLRRIDAFEADPGFAEKQRVAIDRDRLAGKRVGGNPCQRGCKHAYRDQEGRRDAIFQRREKGDRLRYAG